MVKPDFLKICDPLILLNLCLRLFFHVKQNGFSVVERIGKCQDNSAVNDIAAIRTIFNQLRLYIFH